MKTSTNSSICAVSLPSTETAIISWYYHGVSQQWQTRQEDKIIWRKVLWNEESSTASSIFNLFLCPRSLNHSRPLPKWQERLCWLIGKQSKKTKHLFLELATILKSLIIKANEFNWTNLDLILTLNFHSNLIWALFFKYFFKPLNFVRYVKLQLYGGHLLLLWHSLDTEIDQLHAMLSFIDSPHDDPFHGHWSPKKMVIDRHLFQFLLPYIVMDLKRGYC